MAISSSGFEFIDGQPLVFNLDSEPCIDPLDAGYCQPFNRSDPIMLQVKRTPCGDNMVCTDNTPQYEANIILNSGFGSGANWTAGTGWAIAAGVATHTPGNTDALFQVNVSVQQYSYYRTSITVSGRTAGTVRLQLGDGAGASSGTDRSTNATFTENLYAGDPNGTDYQLIQVIPSSDFDGSVDNITLERIYYCYDGANWIYDTTNGYYTHVPGANAALDAVDQSSFIAGQVFKVVIRLENTTAGSVQIVMGNNGSGSLSENGTYTRYVSTGTGTGFFIVPSTDFDGNVYIDEIYVMTEPSDLYLVDMDDNNIADLSPYWEVLDDRINITFTFDQIVDDSPGEFNLPDGCYRIRLSGLCNPINRNLAVNGTFSDGSTGWQLNNGGGQYDFSAGVCEFVFEPFESADLITNGDFGTGDFTGWTAGANWSVVGNAAVHTPGSTDTLTQTVTTSSPVSPPQVLIHWVQLTITGRTAGSITVSVSDATTTFTLNTNYTWTIKLSPTIGGGPVSFTITPTSDFDGTIDTIQLYESYNPWSSNPIIRMQSIPDLIAGTYQISFTIPTSDNTTDMGVYMGIDSVFESPIVYYRSIGSHSFTIQYDPDAEVEGFYGIQRLRVNTAFNDGNNYFPGRFAIDNVTIVRLEPAEGTAYTNCFSVQEDWGDCYKWVEGTGDCSAHGFDFRGSFKIGMRVPLMKFGPYHAIKESSYVHSNGNHELTYAEKDKKYRAKTDKIDEIAHDALITAMLCPTFTIDGEQYFLNDKDYSPEWNRSGRFTTARASFDLSRIQSVTFMNNCKDCAAATSFTCWEYCELVVDLKSNGPGADGWYMVDGVNELEECSGGVFTGVTTTCDGYAECYPGDDTGPYRWNEVAGDWEPIIAIDNINLIAGVVSLDADVLPGCVGRIETSEDGGGSWTAATQYFTSSNLADGIEFNEPANPFRFRLAMRCSTCTYYSDEITDYE